MSNVLRVPLRQGVKRGAAGSQHPVDIYYWNLWRHWSWSRRCLAVLVRLIHFASSVVMALKLRGKGESQSRLRTCWRFALFPRELIWAGDTGIDDIANLIPTHVKKGIDLLLNPNAFPLSGNILLDKRRFHGLMRDAGLPLPLTFGHSDMPGGVPDWARSAWALIYKPGFNSQGRGVERLDRRSDEAWSSSADPEARFALEDWLCEKLNPGDVVQELLFADPEIASRSPGALPTLRVITCLDEQRHPEVTHAVMRFGGGHSFLDNFHCGGVAALLNLENGDVERAMQRDEAGRFHLVEEHPVSKEKIAGYRLPSFHECRDVAKRAHEALLAAGFDMVSVGWDIGVSDRGAILIEGNWNPGLPTVQYLAGNGLGGTRLGQLWSHHMRLLPQERWRNAAVLTRSTFATKRRYPAAMNEAKTAAADMEAVKPAREGSLADALVNTSWLLGSSGVSALLSLVYLAILVRCLGGAGFGQFALITGVAATVAGLVGFQTWQIVIRYGTEHLRQNQREQLADLIKTCIALDLAGALAGAAIAAVAVRALGPQFGWSGEVQTEVLLFCCLILLSARSTPIGVLRLHDRFAAAAAAETVLPVVRLVGAVATAIYSPTLDAFLIVWAASELLTAATYWILLFRSADDLQLSRAVSVARVRQDNPGLFGFAAITSGNKTLLLASQQVPVLIVGFFVSPIAAGQYRLAHQLGRAIARLPQLFARALFPELMRMQASTNLAGTLSLLRRILVWTGAGAAVTLALLLIFGKPVLLLIGGQEFLAAYPLLMLLALAALFEVVGVGFEPSLLALGRARLSFAIQAWVGVSQVLLVWLLAHNFGAVGAAVAIVLASMLRFSGLGLATWSWSRRARGASEPAPL